MADQVTTDTKKHDSDDDVPGRTIAALFQSREEAKAAIKPLHKAHYTHTWLGTTSIASSKGGESAVTVETGGFFSGAEGLVDVLVKHGVLGDTARDLEGQIEPGNAVLTVDPKDHDAQGAIDIITRCGGRLAGGSGSMGAWPARTQTFSDDDLSDDSYFEEVMFARR